MHDTGVAFSALFPAWLILILVMAAALFSYWSYRQTIPPVRPGIRIGLAGLRWLAITAGICILLKPEFEVRRRYTEPAGILVLIDKSVSMSLQDGGIERWASVQELLHRRGFDHLAERYDVSGFGFADSLIDPDGDLSDLAVKPPVGSGTDIGNAWMAALARIDPERPAAIIVVSDGAHNMGADPVRLARLLKQPVWTVGVGETMPARDLMINYVSVTPVVYQNSLVPVEIGCRAVNAAGAIANVILRDAVGDRIAAQRLAIQGDFFDTKLAFEIPVKEPGKPRFSVEIERLEDEITYDNNRRSFYLNVLANRIRLLVMTGLPDESLGYLIRTLQQDDNIELTVRTVRKGSFYEGDWLNEIILAQTDVVILHHFPVKQVNSTKLEEFVRQISAKKLPVAYFDGGQVQVEKLKVIEPILPLEIKGRRAKVMRGQVIPVRRHAVMADPEAVDFIRGWSDLSPVILNSGIFDVKQDDVVLADFSDEITGDRFPAIIVSEAGGIKSVALMMRDLWRWGLAETGEDGISEALLGRMVRWLAVRKVDKRVKISFDRDIFSNQEPVAFLVSVFDENFQPIDGANVLAEVTGNGRTGGRAALESAGRGLYRGSFRSWAEGEYLVSVQAKLDDQVIGEDRGKVMVEPFSIELMDTRLNEELLKGIGETSGGGYVHISLADSLLESLELPDSQEEQVKTIRFWGVAWLLIAIIGLLAVEWLIRARIGML